MSAGPVPEVRGRGGAPPWRRTFLLLGFDDASPARDAVHSERLAAQVRKRTPDQLRQVLAEVERFSAGFAATVRLAEAYRERGLVPRAGHALALNELWRFTAIARDLAQSSLDRPSHALDERSRSQQLRQAATRYRGELDRAVSPGLLDYLRQHAGGWTEPAPGLIAARRQRRLIVGLFTVLVSILVIGLLWIALAG